MLKARLKIRSPKNNRRARLSFQRILKTSFILTQACPDSSLKRKAAAQRSARNKTNDANRKRAELRAGYNALLPQDYRKVPLNIPPLPSQRKWTSHRRLEVVMIWTSSILLFLTPHELLAFGSCSTETQKLSQRHFAASHLNPVSPLEWKLAFKVSKIKVVETLRCCQTKKSFLEEVIGVGVDFSINPKTKNIDYISMVHDLISQSAFSNLGTTRDVFGEEYKLFLPIYFS